jgi:hypothetical protein
MGWTRRIIAPATFILFFVGVPFSALLARAQPQANPIAKWCGERYRNDAFGVAQCIAATDAATFARERAKELESKNELRQRLREDLVRGYAHVKLKEYSENPLPTGTMIAVPAHVRDAYTIVDNSMIYRINGVEQMTANRYQAQIVLGAASSEVREKVLRCIRTYYSGSNGVIPCAMMIRGHTDQCTATFYGVEKVTPCIVVDDAWTINDVGTFQEIQKLSLEFPSASDSFPR